MFFISLAPRRELLLPRALTFTFSYTFSFTFSFTFTALVYVYGNGNVDVEEARAYRPGLSRHRIVAA